ncbi:MAG TPA: right-handed parallel beta-helix repeat-containing protein, partial [Acidimicrobiales bacterium]
MPTTTTTMGLGVPVTPADDVQAILDANPNGTAFSFAPGTYRPPAQGGYTPKQGQRLIGRYGAILNGAKVLSGWTQDGAAWWASAFLPGSNNGTGQCASGTLCTHRQDVFRDGVPLARVATQGEVAAGEFFTDYAANRVYVGDDPAGHLIEQAWNNRLITGTANNVTVQNFVLQFAANDAQTGVVEPTSGASGWTVNYNEVRYNHGVGIHHGTGGLATVTHNYIHDNGQLGGAGQGPGGLWEANEITANNRLLFFAGFEAGGTKWVNTDGLIVRGNYVHDNINGAQLWTDIDNIHTTYENNYVSGGTGPLIEHEISYAAVIRNNTLVQGGSPDGIGVLIFASPDVEVYGNTVYKCFHGIYAFQQDRGTGTYGPREIHNLNVHDNTITQTG